MGCSSLTNITIPSSVTSIETGAFHSCTNLTSITIPSSVTNMGIYAFYNCYSLTIYAEAPSKPAGWDADWNHPTNCPVVWGYVPSDALSIPQNLNINGTTLSWDEVENAIKYCISINDEIYTATTNSFSLSSITLVNGSAVKVKAIGEWPNYADSEWSETIVFSYNPPTTLMDITGNNQVGLTWYMPASSPYTVTGYKVWRCLVASGEGRVARNTPSAYSVHPSFRGEFIRNEDWILISPPNHTTLNFNDETALNGNTYSYAVTAVYNTGDESGYSNIETITLPVDPEIDVHPLSHDFGYCVLFTTSPSQTFTLENIGGHTIFVSGASIIGTNANSFSLTTFTGANLAAGQTVNLSVTFTPQIPVGEKFALLRIAHSGGEYFDVDLSGTGIHPTYNTPQALMATPGNNTVSLVWNVPNASPPYTVTGYRVYRRLGSRDEGRGASSEQRALSDEQNFSSK